jgi:hypothetical protein
MRLSQPHNAAIPRLTGAHEVVKLDLTDSNTYAEVLDGVNAVYSASLDPLLEGHLAFSKTMGQQLSVEHVVRVQCALSRALSGRRLTHLVHCACLLCR